MTKPVIKESTIDASFGKRLYLNNSFDWECPTCSRKFQKSLKREHFEYASTDAVGESLHMICESCCKSFSVPVMFHMTLTVGDEYEEVDSW